MNKDGKDYEEQVDVDTEKETETFRVPKTSPDDEAGEIVYDFKKVMFMHWTTYTAGYSDVCWPWTFLSSLDVSVAVNYNLCCGYFNSTTFVMFWP